MSRIRRVEPAHALLYGDAMSRARLIGLLVVVGLLPRVALAQVGPDDGAPPDDGGLSGSLPDEANEAAVPGTSPAPAPAPAPARVTIVLPPPTPARVAALPVAPPRAAPVAPGPVLPPGMRQVWVHIDSDDPQTELLRHLRRHDDGRRWHTVCVAPCDTFVSTYDDTHFRFSGPGITGSSKFQHGPIGHGRYAVETGSSAQWAMGWVAVGIGGAGFLAGMGVARGPAFRAC